MPARKPASSRKTIRPVARRRPLRGAAGLALRATAGGLMAGGRILAARPVLFGSLAVFSALAGVVADNALNRQGGRHPHPMLSTRMAAADAAPTSVATPKPRLATERVEIANDPRILAFPLVRDVQTLLAQKGYYKAPIDGRAGQATDIAIRAFQKEQGLRVDGMATPLLLSQIRQDGAQPGDAEPARDGRMASLDPEMDMGETGAISDAAGPSELVRQIQAKLSEAKVADIKADGILGERTRSAIRTFQALQSLDVTGEPSTEVLKRLNAVSASR